jgi:hypothetical protein
LDAVSLGWFAVIMIIHTLLYSFPAAMSQSERDRFFAEVGSIMLGTANATTFEHWPHLPLPADAHAPVFAATDVVQIGFPDLDTLAAASALPDMHQFMARWQERFPYQVVWVNHQPAL